MGALNPFAQGQSVGELTKGASEGYGQIPQSLVDEMAGDPSLTPEEKQKLLGGLDFSNFSDRYSQYKATKKQAEEVVARRRGDIKNQMASAGREATILTGDRGVDFLGKTILDPTGRGSQLR